MTTLTPQQKAEKIYNLTVDFFDHPALHFWDTFGRKTIDLLELAPGMRVLDVCCGTGASAIPAARQVGATGKVTGVDIAENLLQLARSKADRLKLKNVEFLKADMTSLPFAPGTFDAAVIVFGIFFVPDMEVQVERLWKLLKPGGRLIITTWGPRIFEPAYSEWMKALRLLAPEWASDFNPWDRITTADAVRELLQKGIRSAGPAGPAEEGRGNSTNLTVTVISELGDHPLQEPEDFWRIALGSGMRWPIAQMGEEKAASLKQHLIARLAESHITSIETNVIYGLVDKPI